MQRAHTQLDRPSRAEQMRGARMLLKAHELAPEQLETMAGMAEAYFVRAFWEEERAKVVRYARKGEGWARKVIAQWPSRAEGYYWAAANIGVRARAAGIMEAINGGLAGKIERMGLRALERDPDLYQGAIQRLLGRYYTKLPWPLTKADRAVALLEEAHRHDPAHVNGMLYLGEALVLTGQEERARALFASCSTGTGPDPEAPRICREHLQSL